MTALIAIFVRIALIYLVIRLVWSFFSKGSNILGSSRKKSEEHIKRYDTKGKKIEEAEFEELQ